MDCGFATIGGNPASGGGTTPSPAGAPGWELARRVRFSTLPTQVLVNGPNIIDGLTFTGANAATAATWQITNTLGLQFAAAAAGAGNTQWTTAGGGQTAANLRISLRTFIPNYDPTRSYVFQCIISAMNPAAVSERVTMGIFREAGVPTGANRAMAWAYIGFNGTAANGGFGASNSGGTGSVDYAWPNMSVLTVAISPGSSSAVSGFLGLAVAGDYPPMSDLRATTWTAQTGTPGAITADNFNDPEAQFSIAFPTGNNNGTFAATISDARVLVAA